MGILRADRLSGLGGANAINGSVRFDKEGYLFVSSHSDWSLDGDFTIECWVKRDAPGAFADKFTIGDSKESTGLELYLGSGGAALNVYSNNGGILVAAAGSYSANVWHHLALVRIGNTIKLYVDGTVDNNTATNTATFSGDLRLGAEFYNNPATPDTRSSFYMSNFRIVKGTALYTANFTVPAQRLENISGTAILCCQSPGDVTQEATGKAIISTTNDLNSSVPYATHISPDKGEDHGTTFEDNTKFDTLSYMVPPGGTTTESNRGRGAIAGGETPSTVNTIEYINIQSMGTAKDFGDLTIASGDVKGLGSSTRGVFRVDNNPSSRNVLEYITFATSSNATDFGDLVIAVQQRFGASNQTRGIFAGGLYPGSTTHNEMDYITIATAGNATDFGNLSASRADTSSLASPTRMIVGGGYTPSTNYGDVMDYVTIASTGNAADFGDLTTGKRSGTAAASSTRGVFGPGKAPSVSNVIDYVTIATTGNATDFGDALVARGGAASASNSVRGLFAGGYTPSKINGIEFITISTLGNGAEFGDMTYASSYSGGCSDSHGGIS